MGRARRIMAGSTSSEIDYTQNTQKMTIFGFKNDTKSLLLTEIELRRCICVAHIPGYQNNTLETIVELLLAQVGRFFEKLPKSPILDHFWPFLANSATCEPRFVCKTP